MATFKPAMHPLPLNIKPVFLGTLDADQTISLIKLANWPMDRVAQRLVAMGSATQEESALHILAYKQFMFMHCLNPDTRCAMYTVKAEEVWQQHVLHTADYDHFCQAIFGQFVHHTPLTQSEAELVALTGDGGWVERFQKVFGGPMASFKNTG